MTKTRVLVNGAKGKMGSETVNAINNTADLELVAQIDLDDDLAASIKECQAEVVVDFTHPDSAFKNVKTILDCKAHAIVGTTGLTPANLAEIKKLCTKNKVNCIVAPNFAIGAILMMKFAREAAHYMPEVEIIELIALQPPPPIPITFILANLAISGLISMTRTFPGRNYISLRLFLKVLF